MSENENPRNTLDQTLWFESRAAACTEALYWTARGYTTRVVTTGFYTACTIRNYFA